MKRPPGRPRTKRIRASSEGGRLGARKRKCRRCGGFGHIQRTCKESVDPAFGEEGYEEPEHEPEPIDVASSSRFCTQIVTYTRYAQAQTTFTGT